MDERNGARSARRPKHQADPFRSPRQPRYALAGVPQHVIQRGNNRQATFPDAWIRVGRFAGTDRRHIADSAEIHAYPARAVEEVIAFFHREQ